MRNYLKNSKIYQNFPFERLRTHLYGNNLIGYDENNEEVILNDTSLTRTYILTFYVLTILFDFSYFSLTSTKNIDAINLQFIGTVIISALTAIKLCTGAKVLRRSFYDIVHYLEIIDDRLSRCYDFNKTKRPVNYICFLLNIVYVLPGSILFVPFTIVHFTKPDNVTIYVAIIGTYFIIVFTYAFNLRLLLNDRLYLFNEVLLKIHKDYRHVLVTRVKCYKCNRTSDSGNLCDRHIILYVDKLLAIFERLLNVHRDLENVIVPFIGSVVLSICPAYILCVRSEFKETYEFSLISLRDFNIISLYFGTLPTLFPILSENTGILFNDIGKTVHKLKLKMIANSSSDTITILLSNKLLMSNYFLKFNDLFVLDVTSLLRLWSSSLTVATLLSIYTV